MVLPLSTFWMTIFLFLDKYLKTLNSDLKFLDRLRSVEKLDNDRMLMKYLSSKHHVFWTSIFFVKKENLSLMFIGKSTSVVIILVSAASYLEPIKLVSLCLDFEKFHHEKKCIKKYFM